MSNKKTENKEPSKLEFYLAAFGALLTIFVFGLMVALAYYYSKEGPVQEDVVEARKLTLMETRSGQKELISTYAWVDKEEKIVRIPIDVAMELTVKDLQRTGEN